MLNDAMQIIEWAALLFGVLLCALAGVGILRMPDVYTRMQASTKAGTLGIVMIVVAVGVHFGGGVIALQAGLVIAFLFLTAPIASHLISRAAYVLGVAPWEHTVIDEMAEQSAAILAQPDMADAPADDHDEHRFRDG